MAGRAEGARPGEPAAAWAAGAVAASRAPDAGRCHAARAWAPVGFQASAQRLACAGNRARSYQENTHTVPS